MSSSVPLRRVGASGLLVSAVGLGCNNFGREGTRTETLDGTREVLDAAIDAGVTFLDTADIYGREPGLSETLMGEALQGRRDEVVLATKFGHFGRRHAVSDAGSKGSRRYIRRAVEASLTRLQTDWIDLYQLHTPDPLDADRGDARRARRSRPRGQGALHRALEPAGLADRRGALHRGASASSVPFVSAQNHYSLLARAAEREVLPAVERFGLGFFPFFPLHNGLLTGKFTRDGGPEDTPHHDGSGRTCGRTRRGMRSRRYQAFCDERGITMLEATFGWLLARPAISSVIAGATSPEQVRANAAAASAWTPDAD